MEKYRRMWKVAKMVFADYEKLELKLRSNYTDKECMEIVTKRDGRFVWLAEHLYSKNKADMNKG